MVHPPLALSQGPSAVRHLKFFGFVVGGAPLDPRLEEFWRSLGFMVIQGYGLTETAPIVSFNHPFHLKPGTARKPLRGVSVSIATDGEILVRGDCVTPGYFSAPAEASEAFESDWFHTGDIGAIDEDGYLIVRGRKNEMIVTPEGLKVFPEDVELVLNRVPGVRDSVAVGRERVRPSDLRGSPEDDRLRDGKIRNCPSRPPACSRADHSPEGQDYLGAMAAAANFAWCNRQIMMHLATNAFIEALGISPRDPGLTLIYDVCHNIAKFEDHVVDGVKRVLCVHRKGATRAFGPGHPELPKAYRRLGQPVLIPGDMGRYSFVLIGLEGAMRETFGSSCHGAGRLMSRAQAMRESRGRDVFAELAAIGVTVRAQSRAGVAEEMPESYKDVADVVEVLEAARVMQRVARLKPFLVIKG